MWNAIPFCSNIVFCPKRKYCQTFFLCFITLERFGCFKLPTSFHLPLNVYSARKPSPASCDVSRRQLKLISCSLVTYFWFYKNQCFLHSFSMIKFSVKCYAFWYHLQNNYIPPVMLRQWVKQKKTNWRSNFRNVAIIVVSPYCTITFCF